MEEKQIKTKQRVADYGEVYISPHEVNAVLEDGEGPFLSEDVPSGKEMINQWKAITSYVGYDHAGQPRKNGERKVFSKTDILPPKTICTETYLAIGSVF
jgi:site-specific DNA-methyltransferase (adenine-specific)